MAAPSARRSTKGGAVKAMLKAGKQRDEIIEDLYLRCFARKPSEQEMAKLSSHFKEAKKDDQVLTDVFWALLNSKEFIFNH
jgi:hypothetical protein